MVPQILLKCTAFPLHMYGHYQSFYQDPIPFIWKLQSQIETHEYTLLSFVS